MKELITSAVPMEMETVRFDMKLVGTNKGLRSRIFSPLAGGLV